MDQIDLKRELYKAKQRIAVLEQVISEAICFPSAGLQDHQIRWLHSEICRARDSHNLRLQERNTFEGYIENNEKGSAYKIKPKEE